MPFFPLLESGHAEKLQAQCPKSMLQLYGGVTISGNHCKQVCMVNPRHGTRMCKCLEVKLSSGIFRNHRYSLFTGRSK